MWSLAAMERPPRRRKVAARERRAQALRAEGRAAARMLAALAEVLITA